MTGFRRCGKRWASKEEAERSKRARNGNFMAVPCRCESFHLQPLVLKPLPARKPQEDTGPDAATRALVLTRDGYCCVRCGKPCGPGIAPYSIQHRIARGVGGGNAVPNLILLDGTATTGCHGAVESKKNPHDHPRGYRLESWQNPAAEPVMYASEDGGVTFYLEADGGLTVDAPAVIA